MCEKSKTCVQGHPWRIMKQLTFSQGMDREQVKPANAQVRAEGPISNPKNESFSHLQHTHGEASPGATGCSPEGERIREADTDPVRNELRSLLAATDVPMVLLDGSLHILRYTPQAGKLLGLTHDSVGHAFHEIPLRLHYPGLADDAANVLERQQGSECEVRHFDGRWFLAKWQPFGLVTEGTHPGLVLTLVDLTERRLTEEALVDSRERLRLIVENARDFAIFTADLQRNITSWNTGAERILGFAEAEILGKSADLIFTPEDRIAMVPEKEQTTALKEGRASDERWHLRRDGSRFWASGSMMAMHDAGGAVVGLLKIFRDQTEARNSRDALERNRQELLAAARQNVEARQAAESATAAKDDFLAALSHELRTPLNPALMTIEDLVKDLSIPEAARLRLATVRRNIELEARLIDDLLDVTGITRGMVTLDSSPCDLHDLLARASEMVLSDPQEGRAALHFDCGAREHWVLGEASRLQQILWNLLKNAFRFTAAGGIITVRTSNPAPGRITVRVTDTGVGISPETQKLIFEPFGQIPEGGRHRFGGLGLGLAVSKALAELHGGTLSVSSAGLGQGATFMLELPTSPDGGGPMEIPPPENSVARPGLRLLVVEDHEASMNALVRLLRKDGHMVFTATSGKEALEVAERETCDAVISDIGLPDISGWEVMREIRRLRGWPGIALSGYGMPADIAQSQKAGFHRHLVKPVRLATIREAILELNVPKIGRVAPPD